MCKPRAKACLTRKSVHENTLLVNTIKSLFEKVRPLLTELLPDTFRRRANPPRRMEIQLEFPWHGKR
jgi:hypothetical protein